MFTNIVFEWLKQVNICVMCLKENIKTILVEQLMCLMYSV